MHRVPQRVVVTFPGARMSKMAAYRLLRRLQLFL